MRRLAIGTVIGFLLAATAALATVSSPEWGYAWDDLRFPAAGINLGSANPPSRIMWRDDGSGSPGVLALEFEDQSVAGNEEQIWGIAQYPHGWLQGQDDVDPHVHWTLEDATDCNVRFCMEHISGSVGQDWPANTTITCRDCPSGGSASTQAICDIFTTGLDMSGHTISALTDFRFFRNSSHANDTCNSKDAIVQTIDFHIRLVRPGSRYELSQ